MWFSQVCDENTCTYTHTHTCTYMYIHTHIYRYTHTTDMQSQRHKHTHTQKRQKDRQTCLSFPSSAISLLSLVAAVLATDVSVWIPRIVAVNLSTCSVIIISRTLDE